MAVLTKTQFKTILQQEANISPSEADYLWSQWSGGGLGNANIEPKLWVSRMFINDDDWMLHPEYWSSGPAQDGINQYIAESRAGTTGQDSANRAIAALPAIPSPAQVTADIFGQTLVYNPKLARSALASTREVEPQYQKLIADLSEGERARILGSVYSLSPFLQKIREKSETPETTALRKQLMGGVLDELRMGSRLTPEQNLQTNEYIRSAESARGFENGGQGSANREAVLKSLEGLKLLENRQGKAGTVLGQEYGASPDPFSTIGNMSTPATAAAVNQTAASVNQVPLSFMGQNYWQAVNAQLAQSQQAANIRQAYDRNTLYGS